MKRYQGIFLFLIFSSGLQLSAQVIWTENFNNGCASGCFAAGVNTGNGAWATNATGANGTGNNRWFVSDAESGMGAGNCGNAGFNNPTLHIGANPNSYCTCFVCLDPAGDCGASYDACNADFCGFAGSPLTNQRAQSPIIITTGYSTLTLAFVYIENGQGTLDDGTVWYSINSGVTWILLVNTAKTPVCVGGQGKWQNASIALPATCNNIATLKIGFNWTNNVDGIGTDPSYAIDDVTITAAVVLPVELTGFSADLAYGKTFLKWNTLTETNNKGFYIERSTDARIFYTLGFVKGAGQSELLKSYSFEDIKISGEETYYYRLKQTDFNGSYQYSTIIEVKTKDNLPSNLSGYINQENEICIHPVENMLAPGGTFKTEILSLDGKVLFSGNVVADSESGIIKFPRLSLTAGIYLITLSNEEKTYTVKLPVLEK